MVDTGGQPEFIEIMPSLIHNSNFTLLVLNLAQSLDEYPPIAFHEDGRAYKRPLPLILTNRQVIHQYASFCKLSDLHTQEANLPYLWSLAPTKTV